MHMLDCSLLTSFLVYGEKKELVKRHFPILEENKEF